MANNNSSVGIRNAIKRQRLRTPIIRDQHGTQWQTGEALWEI